MRSPNAGLRSLRVFRVVIASERSARVKDPVCFLQARIMHTDEWLELSLQLLVAEMDGKVRLEQIIYGVRETITRDLLTHLNI